MDIENLSSTKLYNFNSAGRVNFHPAALKSDFATVEAFKTLRSNLLFCGADIKTIVITSALENEGKSTVAAELAKSLAEIGKKTLMIDADMRKSVVLRRNLKAQNIMGLSELLSDQATIEQVLYNTQLTEFDIIFSGHFPPNPVELLSSPKFISLLEQFKSAYDFVIIDAPPLAPVIDAAVISANCDGAILVISPGKSRIQEALSVKEQLLKSGCKILGAVINQTNPKHRDLSAKKNYYYYGDSGKKKSKFKFNIGK